MAILTGTILGMMCGDYKQKILLSKKEQLSGQAWIANQAKCLSRSINHEAVEGQAPGFLLGSLEGSAWTTTRQGPPATALQPLMPLFQ